MKRKATFLFVFGAAMGGVQASALASFHIMQIEQVIAGVNGDTTAQAIQFRMRSGLQNQVQNGRFFVRDAAGNNPILLAAPSGSVPNSAAGSRVLFATAAFASHTSPPAVVNVTMSNVIPVSYLAAGTLTFEDTFGTIYWRLSWGGAGYTGIGTGSITNDADGQFNPPFGSAIPSTTLQALKFNGAATAASTNNLADYSITAGAAVFTNNAGTNFTVIPTPPSQLAIDLISSPQTANAAFNVIVRSLDNTNTAANVIANTGVSLSATGGATQALGGTTTGQINAGSSSVLISGVTYPIGEVITITATRTSGDSLTPGVSNSITVVPVCATRGDLTGDSLVNGDDVQAFSACVIGGNALSAACGCADSNGDGSFGASDLNDFVNHLLGI